jgi:hypothetical protein
MDCTPDADGRVNCVGELLFRSVADAMVSEGFRDAGYKYVSVDSCWAESRRDQHGHMVANRTRFPGGMEALSRYIRGKGLDFGIYTNMGPSMDGGNYGMLAPGLNCSSGDAAKCPQAKADIEYFTKTLKISYLKVDADSGGDKHLAQEYCESAHVRAYNASYPLVSRLLNESGRAVMLYCSWPVGTSRTCGWPLQYQLMAKHCTAMKQYHDVQDTWDSIQTIIEYWARGSMLWPPHETRYANRTSNSTHLTGNLQNFLNAARPGSWNMPDQLVVGQSPCPGYDYKLPGNKRGMHCDALTHDEEESVFAFWAVWAAPLFLSHDPRATPAASKKILLNKAVIAINQDPLGRQGFRVRNDSAVGVQVWRRQLHDGVAVLLFNGGEQAHDISFDTAEVGFDAFTRVIATDLYANRTFEPFTGSFLAANVPPHGVRMLKVVVPYHDAAAAGSSTSLKTDEVQPAAATLGPIEVVRNSAKVNCGSNFPVRPVPPGVPQNLDIPDEPCRAWANGDEVTMLATHTQARYDRGRTLGTLRHECRIVFNSTWDQDPSQFDDRTWLMSPWLSKPGATVVYALAHMEFHGWSDVAGHGGCVNSSTGVPYETNPEPQICWYNAIVLLKSTDGGDTFVHARPPPHHLVATAPYRYSDGSDATALNVGMGYGDMSNIFERTEDGYLYVFANSRNDYRSMKKGRCLMRTHPEQLEDPGSWRGWDGEGFNVSFVNPYLQQVANPALHVCTPLNISFAPHYLGWSTHHMQYIAVGTQGGMHTLSNGSTYNGLGMVFALSDDLLDWGVHTQLLKPCADDVELHVKEAYPAILDPIASTGLANMDHVGSGTGFLYYMHSARCNETSFNCRDIWRQKIHFAGLATVP